MILAAERVVMALLSVSVCPSVLVINRFSIRPVERQCIRYNIELLPEVFLEQFVLP